MTKPSLLTNEECYLAIKQAVAKYGNAPLQPAKLARYLHLQEYCSGTLTLKGRDDWCKFCNRWFDFCEFSDDTELSFAEFIISGLCKKCQDKVFGVLKD
jgi:hypothetical protein